MSAEGKSKRDSQTYQIIGAAIEVHRTLGHGFLEAVYQCAMAEELSLRSIPFKREVKLNVVYKKKILDCSYQADFVCFDEIIVELKALDTLSPREYSQVLNYLKATGFRRALLINFGNIRLEYKRIVLDYDEQL